MLKSRTVSNSKNLHIKLQCLLNVSGQSPEENLGCSLCSLTLDICIIFCKSEPFWFAIAVCFERETASIVINSVDSGIRLLGFKSWLWHLLAPCSPSNVFVTGLTFYSKGLAIVSTSQWWWWLVAKLCPTLATPWYAPLSIWFPSQKYWSGLPFPSPGNLPNSGPRNWTCFPGTAGVFFTAEPLGKPHSVVRSILNEVLKAIIWGTAVLCRCLLLLLLQPCLMPLFLRSYMHFFQTSTV